MGRAFEVPLPTILPPISPSALPSLLLLSTHSAVAVETFEWQLRLASVFAYQVTALLEVGIKFAFDQATGATFFLLQQIIGRQRQPDLSLPGCVCTM